MADNPHAMPNQTEVEKAVARQTEIRWDLFFATADAEREPSPLRSRLVLAECLEWLAIVGVSVKIVSHVTNGGAHGVRLLNDRGHTMASAVGPDDDTEAPVALLILRAFRNLLAYADQYAQYADGVQAAEDGSFLADLRRVHECWSNTRVAYQQDASEA